MLKELTSGKEKSKFVLITDNNKTSGKDILFTFINGLTDHVEEVHVFAFAHHPNDIQNELLAVKHKIRFHDQFSDPLGWNDTFEKPWKLDSVFKEIKSKNNIAIVIDSLTPLLYYTSLQTVCKVLSECCEASNFFSFNCVQLVALFHEDLHESNELRSLRYIATSVLTLAHKDKIKKYAKTESKSVKLCETFHITNSGKVIKEVEAYQCIKNMLVNVSNWNVNETIDDLNTEDIVSDDVDPAANLTFNLNLNDKEEEARRKLVLPYTKKHLDIKMENNSKSSGDGFIYYEPDEGDDFDEEDPDDDLDF